MAVNVHIPAPLRKLTAGQASVSAAGSTVVEAIDDLEANHPGVREHIFDEAGAIRRFVNIYVNNEDVRFLDGHETALKEGDKVAVLPAVAGGSGELSERERERYTRQMMLDGWGDNAQGKLKSATVFVAGAGGLGSPLTIYLAVAGVGHLVVCDYDAPELSNLNRQIVHNDERIGINKAVSAKQTLETLNPDISVTAVTDKIVAENVEALVGDADLIVDCMDNFPTRFLLNETAIKKGIPLVHGSVWGLEGRLGFFHPPETPCLRCLFPEAPPKEVFPVLGATPGVIGTLEAVEAIKYLSGFGTNLKGKLLVWDGAESDFMVVTVRKDPDCPACG